MKQLESNRIWKKNSIARWITSDCECQKRAEEGEINMRWTAP